MRRNFVDKFVSFFSARAGARRAQARLVESGLLNLKRGYDGASKGRRVEGWLTSGSSPNVETQASLQLLRNRSRDLVRNNPYAARAIQAITTNTVGKGIFPQALGNENGVTAAETRWAKWAVGIS